MSEREIEDTRIQLEKDEILRDAYNHSMDIDPGNDAIDLNEVEDEEYFFINVQNKRAE